MSKIPLKYRSFVAWKLSNLIKSKEVREQEDKASQEIEDAMNQAVSAWKSQVALLMRDVSGERSQLFAVVDDEPLFEDIQMHFFWGFFHAHASNRPAKATTPSMQASGLTIKMCMDLLGQSFQEARANGQRLDRNYNADNELFTALTRVGEKCYLDREHPHLGDTLYQISQLLKDSSPERDLG